MAANMNDENDDPYGLRGGIAPGGVPQRAPIFRDPVRRAIAAAAAARIIIIIVGAHLIVLV